MQPPIQIQRCPFQNSFSSDRNTCNCLTESSIQTLRSHRIHLLIIQMIGINGQSSRLKTLNIELLLYIENQIIEK